MTKKRKVLLSAIVVICISLFVGGTLAYFTAQEEATNVITTGNVDLEIIELDKDGNPFTQMNGIVAGSKVTKKVTVKNTGDNPMFVRVSVDKLFENSELNTNVMTLDYNIINWTYSILDGYFYYNQPLAAGEETKPLFNTVSFSYTMGNEYMDAVANVVVDAQGVQSENNAKTALLAVGWPKK